MDYYKILGVSINASQDEIRKAYKSLALKHHPDKGSSGETFKNINEAYQILGDPERRAFYDSIKKTDTTDNFYVLSLFIDLLKQFIKTHTKAQSQSSPKNQMILNISLTLDEVYRGEIKKLTINTRKLDCTLVSKNVYIPLTNIETEYVFENAGDEYQNNKYQDIVIKVEIAEHPLVKRNNIISPYDLYIEDTIDLYEYYKGVSREFTYLNNEILQVECTPLSRSQLSSFKLIYYTAKGLPYIEDEEEKRGMLYIYFNLQLPENIPDSILNMLQSNNINIMAKESTIEY